MNKRLQIDMMSACMVYEVLFQRLLEAVEQTGEDISEGVHAAICDLLYNIRRTAELPNWERDRLSVQDMSHSVELLSALLGLGVHGHMCFSALPVKTWYDLLRGEVEEVVKHGEVRKACCSG